MHKAMIRRTPHGRRLLAVPDAEAARMVECGEAVPVNSRMLEEVSAKPEADPQKAATYETKVMVPAIPRKTRRGKRS